MSSLHLGPRSLSHRPRHQQCTRAKTLRRASHHVVRALPAELQQLVDQWLQLETMAAFTDDDSRLQMRKLVEEEQAGLLTDMLASRLQFGTAGLRGKMGPGFNRMNSITVQQTSQGLAAYLQQQCPTEQLQQEGVVIGYDGRYHSQEFARIAAAVFSSQGIRVHLFSALVPTPFVATGVRLLGCAAGVMVTASHNPKADNGYKVYWGNACQIIPPHDAGIAAAIEANLGLWELPVEVVHGDPYTHPLISDPLKEVSSQYFQQLATALHVNSAETNAAAPAMVYTAMHGVGTPWVQQAFNAFGLPAPILVAQQCEPDPDFPTVPFPNPEEGKGAWRLAFETAERHGACLAVATDPDADRFAVAERNESGHWRTFTGNEIGALLAHWVLSNHRRRADQQQREGGRQQQREGGRQQGAAGSGGRGLAVLSSTVSSRMLASIARQEGLRWEETLTGFKWLGNEAIRLEQEGYTVLFAFEEAIGFMFGQIGKDKDGVAAAAVFAELAADVYGRGSTLAQHYQELQRQYGVFEYRSGYFLADPPSRSKAVFERLREAYPVSVGGQRVLSVRDLGTGLDTAQPDGRTLLPWQPEDLMITLSLEGPATLTLRASGTEPKLKYYLEAEGGAGAGSRAAAELAARLEKAVGEELAQPERHGLKLPPPR